MDQEKNAYDIAHERATNPATREEFWKDEMEKVFWYEKPKNILDSSNPPFYRWFKDGKTNMCYNCIDRWCETMPGEKALIYESPMANTSKIYTYRDLKDHVSRLAGALHQLNVKVGDRVIIYMPMIPEALMAQYACCRIGAIHSVVFGGFAAKELASRILDAKPKVIITASCGIEPHRIVDYKTILDEALNQAGAHDTKVILYQRPEHRANNIENGRDLDYHTVMQFSQPVDCVPVVSDHPLYILYTSGTTGTPKGIVRDTGGTIVALNWTMEHIMDIHQKEVYFSSSDIGWVVGHSFITYGPLIRGAATILYEGKPTGTPNPGAYWRLIETHKVSGFYTAPTALRALKKEDPDGAWIKKYNTSTLKAISFAGERCDIPTFDWLQGNLPNVLLNDNYWQTEIGWIISCNYKNLHTFKSIPGTATKPCPGFSIDILNDQN